MTCKAARFHSSHPATCPACGGRGKTVENDVCPRCEGRRAVAMTVVRTLFRKGCETCRQDCNGRSFDPKESFVLKHLGRSGDAP